MVHLSGCSSVSLATAHSLSLARSLVALSGCLQLSSLAQMLHQERGDYGKGKPFSDHCNIFFLKVLNNSFYI